jgi:hypothetical protein
MIFDKNRMAKLSGLMVESSHKGIKDAKADNFGGGKEEGDPWLDGDVTTEGAHDGEDDEGMMHMEDAMDGEEGMGHEPMEARRKKGEDDEEKAVREMIRTEIRKAKKDMDDEKKEEQAVREAVRKEIRSVIKSRGVTMGGTGWGFKR